MSTHNIGFYEEISKIITQLSSNIINTHLISSAVQVQLYTFVWRNEPRHEKTKVLVSDLVRHKPGYTAKENG